MKRAPYCLALIEFPDLTAEPESPTQFLLSGGDSVWSTKTQVVKMYNPNC